MSDTIPHAANLLDLDYLGRDHPGQVDSSSTPIIDVHTHLSGQDAVAIYHKVARAYGIRLTYSMSPLEQLDTIEDIMGESIRFIATPDFRSADRLNAFGDGFLERIREFHRRGVTIVKFWAAPRGRDFGEAVGDPTLLCLDSPARRAAMDLAAELGMTFMAHIADPDTWFKTTYADAGRYGTKRDQYEPLERLLDTYTQPWIAAHMGGWPEDLDALDGLLESHDNLHLDTSATKWMVRELSRHSPQRLVRFFTRWSGRLLFGSDIVVREEHLTPPEPDTNNEGPPLQATSPAEATDLYASRYWALRRLFETDASGPSPIADPDLAMIQPDRFGPLDAPTLRGMQLPPEPLRSLYHEAAATYFGFDAKALPDE